MQETWSPTRRLCHKHGRSSTITCRPNTISCKNDIASLFFEQCLWTKIVLVIFWVLCTSCKVLLICSSLFDILMCWCLQIISSTSYKSMWERLCSNNKAKRGDCVITHTFVLVFHVHVQSTQFTWGLLWGFLLFILYRFQQNKLWA